MCVLQLAPLFCMQRVIMVWTHRVKTRYADLVRTAQWSISVINDCNTFCLGVSRAASKRCPSPSKWVYVFLSESSRRWVDSAANFLWGVHECLYVCRWRWWKPLNVRAEELWARRIWYTTFAFGNRRNRLVMSCSVCRYWSVFTGTVQASRIHYLLRQQCGLWQIDISNNTMCKTLASLTSQN